MRWRSNRLVPHEPDPWRLGDKEAIVHFLQTKCYVHLLRDAGQFFQLSASYLCG